MAVSDETRAADAVPVIGGEDWLVAFVALAGSERAAHELEAGVRLGEALTLLNVPAPRAPVVAEGRGRKRAPKPHAFEAAWAAAADAPLASLVARAAPLLVLVDTLAARAGERSRAARLEATRESSGSSASGAVTLTPVARVAPGRAQASDAAEAFDAAAAGAAEPAFEAVDDPMVLVLSVPRASTTEPGLWRPADDPAVPPRSLAEYLLSFDADDVCLALDLGFGAASGAVAEAHAPGMDGLLDGETWLVPVAGAAVAAGAVPGGVVAAPATEHAIQIRAYGTVAADDAQLALADAVAAAARDECGLGLFDQLAGHTAAWRCYPVAGGVPRDEVAVWPLRLFPRTADNRWPLLVLAADGVSCVVDLAARELAGCVVEALAPSRERTAPARPTAGPFIDCWDIPDAAPVPPDAPDQSQAAAPDALVFSAGVRLRCTELGRANGAQGNVFNKLAVLREHGWREEPCPSDEQGRAVAMWTSPAPLQLVGFPAFWRFILRFGANLIIEEPASLRERHRSGARQRLMRFAERAQGQPVKAPEQDQRQPPHRLAER